MGAALSFHYLKKCTLTHKKSNQRAQSASEVRGSKEAGEEAVWNFHFIIKIQRLQKKEVSQ